MDNCSRLRIEFDSLKIYVRLSFPTQVFFGWLVYPDGIVHRRLHHRVLGGIFFRGHAILGPRKIRTDAVGYRPLCYFQCFVVSTSQMGDSEFRHLLVVDGFGVVADSLTGI